MKIGSLAVIIKTKPNITIDSLKKKEEEKRTTTTTRRIEQRQQSFNEWQTENPNDVEAFTFHIYFTNDYNPYSVSQRESKSVTTTRTGKQKGSETEIFFPESTGT